MNMLQETIRRVDNLVGKIDQFYNNYSRSFTSDRLLLDCFNDFFSEARKTKEMLSHPCITVCTVGTTSSGKSTILNGILGRQIAPMSVDEMSAGILSFIPDTHLDKCRIVVKKSKEGYWEACDKSGLSDDEIRGEITRVFNIYKERKLIKRKCSIPEIEVYGSYLWSQNRIFDIDEKINFKFVDLPGLRTEKGDGKNLSVIQNVLREVRPLSILAMDFSELARPETMASLLDELVDTVRELAGSTGSIIFVLNKVDLHNTTDAMTLDEVVERFRRRVIEELSKSLPQYPFDNIIICPLSGLLLDNAQVTIGCQSCNNSGDITYNKQALSDLRDNCSGQYSILSRQNQAFRALWRGIDDAILDNKEVSADNIKELVRYSYELSHATTLYDEIQKRISDNFYEIVIYPAIHKFLLKFRILTEAINAHIAVRGINNTMTVWSRLYSLYDSSFKISGKKEGEASQRGDVLLNSFWSIAKTHTLLNREIGDAAIYNSLKNKPALQPLFGSLEQCDTSLDEKELTAERLILYSQDLTKYVPTSFVEYIGSFPTEDNGNVDIKGYINSWINENLSEDPTIKQIAIEELCRKHSLLYKYQKLYDTVCNSKEYPGLIKETFRKTTNANQAALNVIRTYSKACKANYADSKKKMEAEEICRQKLKELAGSDQEIAILYDDTLNILSRVKDSIMFDIVSPFEKVYPEVDNYNSEDFAKDLQKAGIKPSSVEHLKSLFNDIRSQYKEWRFKSVENEKYVVYRGSTRPSSSAYAAEKRRFDTLNVEMRIAMSDMMSYSVQKYCGVFLNRLVSLSQRDAEEIIDGIKNLGVEIDLASIISLLNVDKTPSPTFPESIFMFASPLEEGHAVVTRYRTNEGICCDEEEAYLDDEYTVNFPTISLLKKNWSRGISYCEGDFWNIIGDWVSNTLDAEESVLENVTSKVIENVLNSLLEQKNQLLNNATNRSEELKRINLDFQECCKCFNLINQISHEIAK